MIQPENLDCAKYPPGSHCGECSQCLPTPTNQQLEAWAKKSPLNWMDEWLAEDMTGMW